VACVAVNPPSRRGFRADGVAVTDNVDFVVRMGEVDDDIGVL
jgi:hypothetical protein